MQVEETDRLLVELLLSDGRMSYTDLAKATGLSTSAAHQRVRRLEERGIIRGYRAIVDPVALDQALTAFLSLSSPGGPDTRDVSELLAELPELKACYSVAGTDSYLLMARVASALELEALANGDDPKLKVKSGYQVGVRIIVPPYPFDDPGTFASLSKDAVIYFRRPSTDGVAQDSQRRPLYLGGRLYTPTDPFATAMLVADGVVAWLGSDGAAEVMRDIGTTVVDLDGALVTPAFVDAGPTPDVG